MSVTNESFDVASYIKAWPKTDPQKWHTFINWAEDMTPSKWETLYPALRHHSLCLDLLAILFLLYRT